ncbi:34329_t:CDS:2, partial [Racocetra persica]
SHTVLVALGIFGGGFGFLSGIYILFFGQQRNNPWGLTHLIMKPKKKDINTKDKDIDLYNLPFNPISVNDDQIPTEIRMGRLESRIIALETILEDYVFDPYALKQLGKQLSTFESDKK